MPRSVAGVYSLPSGSLVTNGQVSAADQHNDPLNDIVDDLNTARPVVAGGTGATSLAAFMTAFLPVMPIKTFATRAAFITWATGAEGAAASANTVAVAADSIGGLLAYIKDSGTAVTDANGWSPLGNRANLQHFRSGTTATLGNTAWTNAVAWLNVGNRILDVMSDVGISQVIPTITGSNIAIIGHGARILMQSGSSGKFFVIGSSGTQATRIAISGLTVQCNNTPAEDDFAFDVVNATVWRIEARVVNVGSVWRLGSATEKAQQGWIDVTGNFNNGLNALRNTHVLNASAIRVSGTLTGSGGACNTETTGALLEISPGAGHPVDTIWFNNFSMQAFNSSTPGASDGKPYGIKISVTSESVTNLLFEGNCVFDHTTTEALWVYDDAASTNTARDWNLTGLRLATDAGSVIRLDKQSASTVIWSGWSVTNNFCNQVDGETAVWISGTGWQNCLFSFNRIVDDTSATAKDRALLINSDGWLVSDNMIGLNTSNGTGFAVGIEITETGLTNITVANNHVHPSITQSIKVPTFSTASAPRRSISWPGRPPIAKASLPTAATSPIASEVYVTDEAGGPIVAFNDGTNWRRYTDRAVVS